MKTYTVTLTEKERGHVLMALGCYVAGFTTRKDEIGVRVVDENLAVANKLVQAADAQSE